MLFLILMAPWSTQRHLQPIIKQLAENYQGLACADPDLLAKLNAWVNTGALERAANDPAHVSK